MKTETAIAAVALIGAGAYLLARQRDGNGQTFIPTILGPVYGTAPAGVVATGPGSISTAGGSVIRQTPQGTTVQPLPGPTTSGDPRVRVTYGAVNERGEPIVAPRTIDLSQPYQPPTLTGRHADAPENGGVLDWLKDTAQGVVEFFTPAAEAGVSPHISRTERTPGEWRAYLRPTLRGAENANGMPSGFLEAIAEKESSFRDDIINCRVLGGVGEQGLMQITPRWHPTVNGCDPIASIHYAGKYLRRLYDRFGTWEKAIAAYNWGPTNLSTKGLASAPSITKNYIAFVRDRVDFV